MIIALFFIGVGLIVAMGSFILLDRRRFDSSNRGFYGMAATAGLALATVAPFIL